MTVYFLSKDEIFAADDLPTEEVEVPEWAPPGVDHAVVRVRGLSGTDRDEYEASMVAMGEDNKLVPELGNMKVKLVARAVVDEDGNLMFTPLDIGRLGQKSAAALTKVYDAAMRLSGMDQEAVNRAVGNSAAAPSGDSTSS